MSKFRLKKSGSGDEKAPKIKEKQARNWGIVATLFTIVLVALILRVFFAYDYAAAGGYALSGGTDAAYHLRSIEYILEHGSQLITDPALNYPYGQLNPNPFLMDWVFAGFASIVTLFGVSTSTAAAGTLVWGTAILGAVTCIPVYMIGREMFNKVAGLVAALLYAVCAMAISNTVMSNGTVAAFYGFLFALMILALVKAVKALSNERPEEQKDNIFKTNKKAVKFSILAGLMLALVALSWSGFRPIVIMVAAMMIVHAVINRIRRKDGAPLFTVYALTLLIGMLIAAPFYFMQELWDLVFSGPFFFTLIAVGVAFIITYVRNQPWLLVVSLVTIAIAVFFVILSFVASDLFSDILFGNALYFDPTYNELVGSNYLSLSAMAGYYGWLTLWLPYILIAYMAYKLPEKIGSAKHLFVMMWMVSMMFISWSSVTTAFLAAPAYAVGGGAVLVWIIYKANIREYISNFKGTGFHFRPLLKKFFRPVPLLTILMALFLVGAPNAVYALDSSISSNEKAEMDDNYLGAMGYFVRNDTDWTMNDVWKSLDVKSDDGALVSWWDYSPDAANTGNLNNVAGLNGAGSSAASNILLASGDKAYLVAMAIRLMSGYDIDDFKTVLDNYMDADQYNRFKQIMENPAGEKKTILNNPNTYGKFSNNLSDENAMYISAIHFIVEELGMSQMDSILLYEDVTSVKGEKISYFAVSRSMFPIVYNDNSAFSTLAFMNNYVLDQYGAPSTFYSINYYGYYDYTDAMYNTLLWRTYIGPAPADYGYTSAIAMFNALSMSDGSPETMAQPGFGVPNTEIAYWKVMYHAPAAAGEDAITVSSDGWVEMDALGPNGAIAKQAAEGGFINYMSGLPVVLKFVEGRTQQVTGTVTDDLNAPVKGARVAVFDVNGIQKNTVFTNDDGEYVIDAPFAGGKIEISVGSKTMRGGLVIEEAEIDTLSDPRVLDATVPVVDFAGTIYLDDGDTPTLATGVQYTVSIEGTVHGGKIDYTISALDGAFTLSGPGLIPDTYTLTVRDESGETVATATYAPTLGRGGTIQIEVMLTKTTLKLDITDQWGNPVNSENKSSDGSGYVKLTNTTQPFETIVELKDGKGEAQVIPGTYVATLVGELGLLGNEDRELFNATVTLNAGETKTITSRAQLFATIQVSVDSSLVPLILQISTGTTTITTVLEDGFSPNDVKVPIGLSTNKSNTENVYSMYARMLDTGGVEKVFYKSWNAITSGPVSITASDFKEAFELSGELKDKSGESTTGTIMVFNNETGDLITSAWVNGEYTLWLPSNFDGNTDGDKYVIYAFNSGSKEAFLKVLETNGGDTQAEYEIKMEDAEKLTLRAVASTSGSIYIPLTPVFIQNDPDTDDDEFLMRFSTNTAGALEIFLPKSSYFVSIPDEVGDFEMKDDLTAVIPNTVMKKTTIGSAQTVTFNTENTTYYTGTITFDVPSGTEVEFKLSGVDDPFVTTSGSYTFTDADKVTLSSHTVTVTPGETTEAPTFTQLFYYSGSKAFNLSNMDITVEPTPMYKIELTGLGSDDKVVVEKMGQTTGIVDESGKENGIYYLEVNHDFQFKVTDKDETKIWYQYVEDGTTPSFAVTLKNAVKVSGYVGFAASGILTITDEASYRIVVKVPSTGVYEATLPEFASYEFWATVGYDEGGTPPYTYDMKRVGVTLTGEGPHVVNLAVMGAPASTSDEIEITPTSITYDPAKGEFTMELTLSGVTKPISMMLSGGSAWEWIEFYNTSGDKIDHVVGNASFKVVGKIAEGKAFDDSNLSIIFKDLAGKDIVTSKVLGLGAAAGSALADYDGDITIGRGEFDKVSEFEHRFSVSVKNDTMDSKQFLARLNGAIPTGWLVVVTDEKGTTIGNALTWSFSVPGKTTSTFYFKFITEGGPVSLPENFEVEITVTSAVLPTQVIAGAESTVDTTGPEPVVTTKITPTEVELNTDGNDATGPNVFTKGSSISNTTWALVILAALILMFILWQGTKRGVFSRRK